METEMSTNIRSYRETRAASSPLSGGDLSAFLCMLKTQMSIHGGIMLSTSKALLPPLHPHPVLFPPSSLRHVLPRVCCCYVIAPSLLLGPPGSNMAASLPMTSECVCVFLCVSL